MTLHPSKVPYTLESQIARYLDGDLGVYRPAIGLDDTLPPLSPRFSINLY